MQGNMAIFHILENNQCNLLSFLGYQLMRFKWIKKAFLGRKESRYHFAFILLVDMGDLAEINITLKNGSSRCVLCYLLLVLAMVC